LLQKDQLVSLAPYLTMLAQLILLMSAIKKLVGAGGRPRLATFLADYPRQAGHLLPLPFLLPGALRGILEQRGMSRSV